MKRLIFCISLICFCTSLINCNETTSSSTYKMSYQEETPTDIFVGEWEQFLDVNGNDLPNSIPHKKIKISKSDMFYLIEEGNMGNYKSFEGENGKYKLDFHLLKSISSTRMFIYDGENKYLQEKFYDPPGNPYYFGGYYKKVR